MPLSNWLLELAKSAAKKSGREPAIIVDEHSIEIKFRNPESDNYAWDNDLYNWGNIFFKDKANPIKLHADKDLKDGYNLISSKKYQQFMKFDAISQALNPNAKRDQKLQYLLYGVASLQVLLLFTIVGLMA